MTSFFVQKNNSVEIEVQATPRDDEEEVCSVRLSVELPVADWGQGLYTFLLFVELLYWDRFVQFSLLLLWSIRFLVCWILFSRCLPRTLS